MEKMMMSSFFVLYILSLSLVCRAETIQCEEKTSGYGEIIESATSSNNKLVKTYSEQNKCWIIVLPEDSSVKIEIESMTFNGLPCSDAYVRITTAEAKEPEEFCSEDAEKTITSYDDVTIAYFHNSTEYGSLLALKYQIESGISTIKGLDAKRKDGISWLKSKQLPSHGWDQDTARVITALYLSGATNFSGDDVKEELMVKQLEVQTAVALLRNSANPLSVNEISMFINALRAACHNPRQFYGYDVLKILSDRMVASKSDSPAAYLTLCSSNWTVTEANVRSLLKTLEKPSALPFYTDVQAMTVMALSCMKNKTNVFERDANAVKLLNNTIQKFMSSQLPDGSFGNIHTTALITQALLSSGLEKSKEWNVTTAIRSLMNQDPSSIDYISTSLVLPILNAKCLADITTNHCNKSRKQGRDREILDVMNKAGTKKLVEYALHVGDNKDIMHVIYLRMPESSTAFDVMNVAAHSDPKYNFTHTDLSGHMYVHNLAGISNDPEGGKFWHLYFGHSNNKGRIALRTESPDKITLKEGDYMVMWYKTIQL